MTAKRFWFTNCKNCNKQLVNHGSGRPKKYCNAKCVSRLRSKSYIKKSNNRWRKNLTSKEAHQLVNSEKLRKGKCVLHPLYHNGEEYACTQDRLRAFCWDHIDRTKKIASISRLIGASTQEELLTEINKCWLVCANCHQMKTYENKDWLQIVETLQPEMAIVYNQPTLFDN